MSCGRRIALCGLARHRLAPEAQRFLSLSHCIVACWPVLLGVVPPSLLNLAPHIPRTERNGCEAQYDCGPGLMGDYDSHLSDANDDVKHAPTILSSIDIFVAHVRLPHIQKPNST